MHLSPAEYVIHMFGGVRATARALNKTPSAISKWQTQGSGIVPSHNMLLILKLAQELNLDITPDDLVIGRKIKPREFIE